MSKISAKNATIVFAGNTLSKDCVSYTVTDQLDALDVTGFTDGARNFVPGLLTGNVTIDFLWNSATDGAFTILNPLVGTLGSTLFVWPESTSVKGWKVICFLQGINPTATPGSELKLGTATFCVNSTVTPLWSTT
jgi:hypothetical protein